MKRFLIGICTLVLCISVCACTSQDKQQENTSNSSTNSKPNKAEVFGPIQTYDVYEHGEHHVRLTFKDFEGVVELTIYSDAAPKTASMFCHLVRDGYYNNLSFNTIMKDLYMGFGDRSAKSKGEHLVVGEYEEAGVKNYLSLKRGIVAMSRTEDGKSSDASSILIIMSDASYLNGNYAAFAKVSKGLDVLDDISSISFASSDKAAIAEYKKKQKLAKEEAKAAENTSSVTPLELQDPIIVKADGTIQKKKMCPVIKSMKVVD